MVTLQSPTFNSIAEWIKDLDEVKRQTLLFKLTQKFHIFTGADSDPESIAYIKDALKEIKIDDPSDQNAKDVFFWFSQWLPDT